MYCTECKCCPAQKGFNLCAFCEDGVACPGRKRQASGLEAKPSRPLVAEMYATRAAKEPNPKSVERPARLQRANVALISSQVPEEEKSTIVDASPAPELPVAKEEEKTTMYTDKICGRPGCGKYLTAANKSGFCTAHFYDSKKKAKGNGSASPDPTKPLVCSVDGCDKKLRSDNKSGICTPHSKAHTTAAGSPSKATRSKATPPRKLNSTPAPAPMGVATIRVTETHLNNYWSRLSLDEKAAIFTQQLEGV